MQGMKQEMSEFMEFDIDVLQKDYLDNGYCVAIYSCRFYYLYTTYIQDETDVTRIL